MIREAIAKLMEGTNLSQTEAETVMQEIMDGDSDARANGGISDCTAAQRARRWRKSRGARA